MKRFIAITAVLLALTGCGHFDYNENDSNNNDIVTTEIITTTENPDKHLSMDKLMLTIKVHYIDDDSYTLWFVQSDGSVYSGSYTTITNHEFFVKLQNCDDLTFEDDENAALIGNLSESDTKLLNQYVSEVDINSDFYERSATELRPDVEETVYYVSDLYIPTENGKTLFNIQSCGLELGVDYETNDKNALSALELVKNSGILSKSNNDNIETAPIESTSIKIFDLHKDNYPDKLYTNSQKDVQLVVFKCGDDYFGSDTWSRMEAFTPETEMKDGDFALITADVTFLSGGVAGYMNVPQIDCLKSFEITDLDTVMQIYDIPKLSKTDIPFYEKMHTYQTTRDTYCIFLNHGAYHVYAESGSIQASIDSMTFDYDENFNPKINIPEFLDELAKAE